MSTRCPSCDPNCRFVPFEGRLTCSIMAIGEKPGQEEDHRRRPFCGQTGQEVEHNYLPLAGLERKDVFLTNAVKCRLGGTNKKPSPKQISDCSRHHIASEIDLLGNSLEVILLLGSSACSEAMGVRGVELDKDHGIPFRSEGRLDPAVFGDWSGWVWPMYHPAAGLHNTGMMSPMLDDWHRFGMWRRGRWEHSTPVTAMARHGLHYAVDYAESSRLEMKFDLQKCANSVRKKYTGRLPVDTESVGNRLWSAQYSLRPGHARMVRGGLLQDFARYAIEGGWRLVLHNATHDRAMLRQIRTDMDTVPFYDTMQEAYQLRSLPQGLKALGWRLLGVRMTDYSDVVMPHSKRALANWLMGLYADEEPERIVTYSTREPKLSYGCMGCSYEIVKTKPITTLPRHNRLDGSKCPRSGTPVDTPVLIPYPNKVKYKRTQIMKDLERILSHLDSPTYDPWKRCVESGLSGIDGYPRPSVELVPDDEILHYACQDADVTGMVMLELERLRGEVLEPQTWGSWHVHEGDRDNVI